LKIFAQNLHILLRIDYISMCVIHFKCTSLLEDIQGAAEKSSPLKFFAVFLATVQHFNLKIYRFIY